MRAAGQTDRLLLANGDELDGSLIAILNNAVKFETDLGPIDVETDRVTALILNPAQKHPPPASDSTFRAWAGFSDGTRLLAKQLLLNAASLKITATGQSLGASPHDLVFLQPLGGRAIYLPDLKPTEYHHTPYLDFLWPYHTDRNVTGGLLRSGGRLYLKGLGLHSAARLIYNISPLPLGEGPGVRGGGNPKFSPPNGEGQGVRATDPSTVLAPGPGPKALGSPSPGQRPGEPGEPHPPSGPTAQRFAAELAIDDSTAGQGSVQFRVLVDGQEKFASPIIRGGDPPLPVSVDVTGGKKLELIVDYADRADVLDHANWLNARLTK